MRFNLFQLKFFSGEPGVPGDIGEPGLPGNNNIVYHFDSFQN